MASSSHWSTKDETAFTIQGYREGKAGRALCWALTIEREHQEEETHSPGALYSWLGNAGTTVKGNRAYRGLLGRESKYLLCGPSGSPETTSRGWCWERGKQKGRTMHNWLVFCAMVPLKSCNILWVRMLTIGMRVLSSTLKAPKPPRYSTVSQISRRLRQLSVNLAGLGWPQ